MSRTADCPKESEIEKQLEDLARQLSEAAPQVAHGIQGIISAIRYNDEVLKLSSARAVFDSLCDFLQEYIEKEIKKPIPFRESVQKFIDIARSNTIGFHGHAASLDKMGKKMLSYLDKRLYEWTQSRDAAHLLATCGCEVPNVKKLEHELEETRAVRNMIADNWPWDEPTPVKTDREMVARSRAAFKNGECQPTDKVIESFGQQARNDEK